MFAVRIHGRGGQAVLALAEMLAAAAVADGNYAQASTGIDVERRGLPAEASCRIDDRPLAAYEPVVRPDAVVVLNPTLPLRTDVFDGLTVDGFVLVDSTRSLDNLGLSGGRARFNAGRAAVVPASAIARRDFGQPLPNTAMLGAVAALTGAVSTQAVETAIRQRFGGRLADDNVEAAFDAAAFVRYQRRTGAAPEAAAR